MQGFQLVGKRILLGNKTFDPDDTFAPSSTPEDIFASCSPIIESVKNGTNGTVMVYGQTGSGKTHTMIGSETEHNGLAFKAIANLLEHVSQRTVRGFRTALTLSMLELYNERLTDMISADQSEIMLIQGIPRRTEKVVLADVSTAATLVKKALSKRQVATTNMNERSSRSHVIIMLTLEEFPETCLDDDAAPSEEASLASSAAVGTASVSTLFLVDLAGSESVKKSQVMGKAAAEAGTINKSLLALKMVILALTSKPNEEGVRHVPYRDSKLTQLLQDSIGGTARTMLIACISCVGSNIDETQSTLEYASKARSIRNVSNMERDRLSCRVRSLEGEIQKLKNRLQDKINEKNGVFITKEEYEGFQEAFEENNSLKIAVEELMKDKEQVEARQHIRESQLTMLHKLLKDKDMQVEKIRHEFEGVVTKIDATASELTRVHRETISGAQTALVQHTLSAHAASLEWQVAARELEPVIASNQARIDGICSRVTKSFSLMSSQFTALAATFAEAAVAEERRRQEKFLAHTAEMAKQFSAWHEAAVKESTFFHETAVKEAMGLTDSAANIARRHLPPDVKAELFDLVGDVHVSAVDSVASVLPGPTLSEEVLGVFGGARHSIVRGNRQSVMEPLLKENTLRLSAPPSPQFLLQQQQPQPPQPQQRATFSGLPPMTQRSTTNSTIADVRKRSRTPSTAADDAARRSGKPAQRAS
jgi:hypothetical protein